MVAVIVDFYKIWGIEYILVGWLYGLVGLVGWLG